uniref:ATP synthase complex subunit 8 n=1 Tax=Noctilio leporinus TaxID=94963 RepID=A0A342YV34_NOCLE|nr:ATP synthase F0 subunit 8 [Noctilio leporinus]AOS49742.1 ATP synthase F0 subunit 8 [Noctilio leporinus]
MPQLDTSTWTTIILSMLLTLFIIMQLKISSYYYYPNPEPATLKPTKPLTPWKMKWTKIYSPLSLPQQ